MHTLERRTMAVIMSASLVAAVPGVTAAQDDAASVMVEAVGGADALGGLTGFVVEASGTRGTIDEGPTPGEGVGLEATFEAVSTVDIAGNSIRNDYSVGASEFGAPRAISEVVVGDIGFFDGQDGNFAAPGVGPLLSDRVTSIRTHQQLLNPHLLLLEVAADPSMGEAGNDSVTIAHGTTPITITMDPDSGLPASAATLESDPLRRDVELVASYQDWAETESGVSFPATVNITYDGELVHQESRTVTTDVLIDESMFAVPEGVEPAIDATLAERGDLNHQYLQSFAAGGFPRDGLQLGVEATEIMPGVFHIAGGTHHTLAVLQEDGVVLIEAPVDETRSAVVQAWLETVAPGQPVTHVIQSHHHSDHSGGLRSLAGSTGATVVAGEAALPLYEDVFAAESTLLPDGIDGSTIETMGVGAEPVTIDDSTNPVTAYAFPNPHADDYLLVDAAGALWVVDIFSPGTGAPFPEFLADFVDNAGLDISHVVGGHGSSATWEDLTAS